MIRVLSLTVYNAKNSDRIYYESFKERYIKDNDYLRRWRVYLEAEWKKITKHEVKVYIIRRMKPTKEIDMVSVLMNTANVMGQNYEDVIIKGKKRELVDVRKVACMIIMDADYPPMEIERQLPFRNRVIYDYRTKMEDRMVTDKGFEKSYKEIRSKVMALMKIQSNGSEPK